MPNFKSVDEILDFAMNKEEKAHQFYLDLAKHVGKQHMVQLFEEFAAQEAEHKSTLMAVKQGKKPLPAVSEVLDLRLSEQLTDTRFSPEMDYQDALTLAMKQEKASFWLYTQLAQSAEDPRIKSTFSALAQEEARHKLHLEIEYDEYILTDN